MSPRRITRPASLVLAALAIVIAAAACGSSTSATPTTPGTSADVSKLGPAKAATGTPITLGYIAEGKTATEDTSGEEAAANAAASYVNDHLGGINGHPIKLMICHSQLTPAGATDCANQMIAAKVPAVLAGTPAVPAPIVTALDAAGIPFFADVVVDTTALFSADVNAISNALGFIAAPIKMAKDQGFTKVATLLIDVPAAVGPVKLVSQPLYDKAGVTDDITAVAPGTPDMTPQVQAALGKGAQMFVVIGEPAFCTSALSALHTLGFEGTKFINSQCLSPDLASSVPGGLDGVKVGTNQSLDPADPEVQLYEAAMAQYAPGVAADQSATPAGYRSVLGFTRAMSGLTGDLTSASAKNALATMAPQPVPLLSGQTFQCTHKIFKLTPAVCSSGFAVVTLDADGKPTATDTMDVGPLVNG
jgi:branched-chain amino acid transport system substrate-binding protein